MYKDYFLSFNFFINITSEFICKCNLHEFGGKKEIITKEIIDKFFEYLPNTTKYITLVGGDPLLYPELCFYVKEKNKKLVLMISDLPENGEKIIKELDPYLIIISKFPNHKIPYISFNNKIMEEKVEEELNCKFCANYGLVCLCNGDIIPACNSLPKYSCLSSKRIEDIEILTEELCKKTKYVNFNFRGIK